MTDGFRCSDCERILNTPATLAAGNCGLHPRKHEFETDPYSADCLECGMPFGFGGLHPQRLTEVVDLEPVLCDGCAHEPHEPRACRYVRVLHIGTRGSDVLPCHCAAAA